MSAPHLRAAPLRLAGFTFLWWVLSEGVLADWPLVSLFALLATTSSLVLLPPASVRLRPLGLVRFLPYFLWQSLLGGLDVARRAFSPRLPLSPGFTEYPLKLRSEAARVFFVWTVSLMPGTASTELLEGTLKLHVLDTAQGVAKLKGLEARVARLFAGEGDA